jgi:CRISPR-associated protein Cmr3
MKQWYSFKPTDTLFFRGASPSQMGEDHSSISIFPPPSSTIIGALRTTVLVQNDIDFKLYGKNNDKIPQNIYNSIGKAGKEAPFSLTGPFFRYKDVIFVPAPYSWYFDKSFSDNLKQKIFKIQKVNNSLLNNQNKYWIKGDKGEVSSIGGKWISLNALIANKENCFYVKNDDSLNENKEKIDFNTLIVDTSFFFKNEIRTGIALQKNRKVHEGHIYSFTHARLKEDVDIVWAVDKELPLKETGILKLGAEQRFGHYKKIDNVHIDENSNKSMFMSLSLTKGDKESNKNIVSTGKINYIGGWDMKKGFHKEMQGYFPAGTVFSKKLNDNFISIN